MIKVKMFFNINDENEIEEVINKFFSDNNIKEIINIQTTTKGYTDRIYIYYKQ